VEKNAGGFPPAFINLFQDHYLPNPDKPEMLFSRKAAKSQRKAKLF
jgi:hypothetical protein